MRVNRILSLFSFVTFVVLTVDKFVICPFRGCAGDWVKLGVAKRHGAVLGDAICLNSSLPCVLVDAVKCKMGKFSCCVPGCTNCKCHNSFEIVYIARLVI